MRTVLLLLTATVASQAVGCKWLDDMRGRTDHPRGTGKLPEVTAPQLVGYLNDRASRLQSIEYARVHVRCQEGLLPLPMLDGQLACAQPRNFRMKVDKANADVDLGSNPDQFWVYVKVPTEKPMFVFASHSDFEAGRAKLPGGIPFEPDWVMQAFGMLNFPPNQPYTVEVNDRDRLYILRWTATTPTGHQVIKEVLFDGDSATGNRPQVKKHLIRDARSKKVITYAEIKSAQTVQVGTDPATGYPLAIQYPTRVVLRWEEQKFEMDLTLERATVNQPIADDPQRRLFVRPTNKSTPALNLAEYTFR